MLMSQFLLVVAHLHQELIICTRYTLYYQLLEQKKLFEIMQTLCLVHIMLTQLLNAERVNSVWGVYMENGLKNDKNYF